MDEAGLKMGRPKSNFLIAKAKFFGYSLENGTYGMSEKQSRHVVVHPPEQHLISQTGQVNYFCFLIPELEVKLANLQRNLSISGHFIH